jgi:Methylamine utilisation protein MauE
MTGGDFKALTAATAAAYTCLLFAHATWHKLSDFRSFAGFVAAYEIVPEWTVPAVSRMIVTAELFVTLLLIAPGRRGFGACLAIATLLGYAAAMTANIARGRNRVECGCGGAPQLLRWPLVVRNIALTGVAGLVLLSDSSGLSMSAVAIAIAGGFTLWTVFVLVEQILTNASRAQLSRQN